MGRVAEGKHANNPALPRPCTAPRHVGCPRVSEPFPPGLRAAFGGGLGWCADDGAALCPCAPCRRKDKAKVRVNLSMCKYSILRDVVYSLGYEVLDESQVRRPSPPLLPPPSSPGSTPLVGAHIRRC